MPAKLYMILLGCKPANRFTEQHDVFFGIGDSLKALVPNILAYWPEAEGKIHLDAWREVSIVDGYAISVLPKDAQSDSESPLRLFFLNLGGYQEQDFEEYHYKVLTVAEDKATAIQQAKETAFFKHNRSSHIDDKYGVDVDDIYEISEILPAPFKENYRILIGPKIQSDQQDEIHPEYLKLSKLV